MTLAVPFSVLAVALTAAIIVALQVDPCPTVVAHRTVLDDPCDPCEDGVLVTRGVDALRNPHKKQ